MQYHNSQTAPTLASVSDGFSQWRAADNRRLQTPEALQQQSVTLLQTHSKATLCRSLKISYSALNQWVSRWSDADPTLADQPTAGFIALPAGSPDLVHTPSANNHQPDTVELRIDLPRGTTVCTRVPINVLLTLIHQPGGSLPIDRESGA